ncbi:tol-pal system YbgF family protein [Flavobacterium defluvii]|uniref:Uncharacterized protein n=1 Tax=Flavobacterium defluvii TaxID=370979 RepID=A0A1M5ECW7_9FLAO|nr:hypothetical protein [Flavobacterium defluvii]SHF77089.1 hypothetical protein SAMN05443663_10199 [Flavobacterium defluvii]
MKKTFIVITFGVLLSSCKQTDKPASNKKEIKNDSIKTEIPAKTAQSDLELLELFSKNKNEIILKLKSISNKDANALYEKYFEENGYLIHKIEEKSAGILDNFYSENETDKKNVKLLEQKLAKYQLKLEEIGEGYVEITTKNDFYYTIFKDYVTKDYKDYLYLKSEENKSLYSADAGLVISFKDLGDRIISWENFLTKYPDSKLIESVKDDYKRYQMDYLIGQDNTPTFENAAEEKYIYPENIQEFDRFVKKYPKSPTVPLIALFKENFKNEKLYDMITTEQAKL